MDFHGIIPYLVSPVGADGRVLEAPLRRLVEHLIGQGVHGLSPLGSTGEAAYLSLEQRLEIVRIVVEQAAGRAPTLFRPPYGEDRVRLWIETFEQSGGKSTREFFNEEPLER